MQEQLKDVVPACNISVALTGGSDFAGAVRVTELENPDEIIVLTSTPVQSYKDTGVADDGNVSQCFGSAVHYGYSEKLEHCMKAKGIRHQRVASLVNTNTPADACTYLGKGIPTAMFAVPVKYTNTSVSMVSEPAVEYLVGALLSCITERGA